MHVIFVASNEPTGVFDFRFEDDFTHFDWFNVSTAVRKAGNAWTLRLFLFTSFNPFLNFLLIAIVFGSKPHPRGNVSEITDLPRPIQGLQALIDGL